MNSSATQLGIRFFGDAQGAKGERSARHDLPRLSPGQRDDLLAHQPLSTTGSPRAVKEERESDLIVSVAGLEQHSC